MAVLHIDGQKYQTNIKESTTWCDLTINGATLDDTGLYYCLNQNSFIGDGIKVRVLGRFNSFSHGFK